MNWEKLTSVDQLNEVDLLSKETPVVLFKHSTSCSISATALNRVERKWNQEKHPDVKAFYLDLLSYRAISNEISQRYGIQHQSPQVLIINNGTCSYENSHFGISYDEIVDNIEAASI
ncbi:MAG: bacillithiol system redox-active protein YtxJ [Cyclobacteriaceae bacterium]